jgi:Fe-S-cluster containining protein
MGEIIEVIEETSPMKFRIGYTTTCEERIVIVDPDKRDLFLSRPAMQKRSLACPFLRMAAPGRVICTVHSSRPDLCRQYSCFRLLVLNNRGNRIGKVLESTRILRTMDHTLRELWDREIDGMQITEEECWEKSVEKFLVLKGYTVIT